MGYLGHPDGTPATKESITALLTEHKLTVNHVRDSAGVRGQSAHDALETYAKTGHRPNLDDYPEEERGYVEGVDKFIVDSSFEPIETEVMVGSAKHGYAGRYDLLANQSERTVVTRNLKRQNRTEELPSGVYLYDLKTTKYVYDTHHLQLSAYEGASRECGYTPSDQRAVVLVSADGTYEVHRSEPCYPQWLAVLGAYNAMRTFKKGRKP